MLRYGVCFCFVLFFIVLILMNRSFSVFANSSIWNVNKLYFFIPRQ